MDSEEDTVPRPCLPRQPRLLPRAGRLPPHWARGRSPIRGRGHRRIPIPVPRRPGPPREVGRSPEGYLGVQDRAPGYGEAVEWNRSFQEGQQLLPPPRKPEGPVRGHSVPDPYHGASGGDDGEDWENIAPSVSASYSLPELPHLSEDERQRIMEVIRRDEHLRRQDELRVMRLKAELQFLRRKGALRADWDPGAHTAPSPGGLGSGALSIAGLGGLGSIGGNGSGRACARCRAELGRIINRGAFCRACRLRVCKACREYNVRATDWVCSVCHKHMEIQVATGEWMNEFVRRPSRRRDNRVYVPAADIVKRSIRRSWTISTSHRRSFGGPHGSPELRAYSSLPRGASYLPAAAAEAAADAADAAARRLNESRETTPHRRLPANPLFSLLRRGSSGGDDIPHRKATSLEEDIISGPLARDDSVFVETRQESITGSPGRKNVGRKGASLRRQQAVWTGSTGSTGPESSGGESPGQLPKSPKTKEFGQVLKKDKSKEEEVVVRGRGTVEEDEDEEEDPVEDFDVEPISGTIFRKVTIRKKKKKKVNVSEEEGSGECEDSGVGDAGTTTPTSASPTVAPSPSLGRSEKPFELSRRLGTQEDGGSPAAAALLLDYVLDEGKIQPDGEDYKLVFISSDSSSKASTTNSDEEAPAEEDCDWDYFEPARREIGGGGEGVPPPSPAPPSPPPRPTPSTPEVSKLLPATQSGAPALSRRHAAGGEGGVVALTDHIFFVEPMPAADGTPEGQAEGGLAVSRRARRRRARRVGRSRSETDLARLHLRLAPDAARFAGERSGSGGFVIDEGPTILAAGEFGPAGTVEGTGIRMWTVERDAEEYGPGGKRTIIPVPVPVPVPAWPARFEKGEEGDGGGSHTLPRGSMGDAVSVADIVYLGPAGSNAVRIRIRSFQRSSSQDQPTSVPESHSSVSHVSVVGSASSAPSSWYAWHRVLDSQSSPTQAFTSSVTLSSSLQDCYSEGVGETTAGGLKEIIEINTPPETLSCHPIEEERVEVVVEGFQRGVATSYSPSDADVESGAETAEEKERKDPVSIEEVVGIEPGTVGEKEGEVCSAVAEGELLLSAESSKCESVTEDAGARGVDTDGGDAKEGEMTVDTKGEEVNKEESGKNSGLSSGDVQVEGITPVVSLEDSAKGNKSASELSGELIAEEGEAAREVKHESEDKVAAGDVEKIGSDVVEGAERDDCDKRAEGESGVGVEGAGEEVVENEECNDATGDTEESRNAITKKESREEITAGEWVYKEGEALEGGGGQEVEVLIGAPVVGDVSRGERNNLERDKEIAERPARCEETDEVPRENMEEEEEEASMGVGTASEEVETEAGSKKEEVTGEENGTAATESVPTPDEEPAATEAINESKSDEGNPRESATQLEITSQELKPEDSVEEVIDNSVVESQNEDSPTHIMAEEDGTNENTARVEETSTEGGEDGTDGAAVLLSYRPLFESEEAVEKVGTDRAWADGDPSHTPGAKEISRALSPVGGVAAEEWVGKEVGLPHREATEGGQGEGETAESSGTSSSVVQEIRRGADDSCRAETEGPSEGKEEKAPGKGRKRRRNRKRRRRRGGKQREEEVVVEEEEPPVAEESVQTAMDDNVSDEDSVAAPDSDEYETSSGEFDLASARRWAIGSIMTPPSVSSNSDAAGNSEESDSDDENFSRVFVVNAAEDEEDEGVGREREEEEEDRGGEVIEVVKELVVEGAVEGVRLMHIRALTDDDHVAAPRFKENPDRIIQDGRPPFSRELPGVEGESPAGEKIHIEVEKEPMEKDVNEDYQKERNAASPTFCARDCLQESDKVDGTDSSMSSLSDKGEDESTDAANGVVKEEGECGTPVDKEATRGDEREANVGEENEGCHEAISDTETFEAVRDKEESAPVEGEVVMETEGDAASPSGESRDDGAGESEPGDGVSEEDGSRLAEEEGASRKNRSEDSSGQGVVFGGTVSGESGLTVAVEGEGTLEEVSGVENAPVEEEVKVEGGEGENKTSEVSSEEAEESAEVVPDNPSPSPTTEAEENPSTEGNMLQDPLLGEPTCGGEEKPPQTEGERTPEKEDRISPQLHAKATGEQVSPEGGEEAPRPPEGDSTTPALKTLGGEVSADGSEMAPASDEVVVCGREDSVGGESPEVAEETDPVPAGEPTGTPASPSLPGEEGSVDDWKATSEDCFGGNSLRWGNVGGGRAGEGRCVSLEDILNPEGGGRSFSGSEAAVTTGGGGGVYTSYVMITQDGGASREGLRRECHDVEEVEGAEEVVLVGEDANGRHQRVNVSVVTTETTTLVSEEEDEQEEEMDENDGEMSDEGGVVLRHVNWEEEEGKSNMGLAGYFTLTLETGTASPTPPRRPEVKSRKTIQLKDPSGNGNGVVDLPICGDLSGGEMSGESDEGRNGGEDAVKVVTGGDTLSAVVCLEEGLADDDSWVEEVDATIDDLRDDDDDELGSESVSSGDEAYFDREEELRGYNRAIDFTLHTILEESGEEESEAENNKSSTQGNMGQMTLGSKHKANNSNADADASELEKYYFFGLGNAQDDGNEDQKFANEESEISDTVSETSCSSIYSEGLESLGIAGTPGHDGITEMSENIMGMDPAELASSRLEKYFLTGFLGLEPPRGLRAPLGDEDGFSENTDESGSVGSDSEGRHSPEQRRKRLVRARGAGRQHHNSGGSGGAASDAEAAAGSPSGGESSSIPQVTHSQNHLQQQQKNMGQQQQQQAQNSGQEAAEGEDSSTETDSFDETAFEKGDGQFDTVKRKKKKRKENRHQEDGKEECVAISGEEMDGAKTPQPDLETVAEEEEDAADAGNADRRDRAEEVVALEVENGLGPGGQGGRKQASRDSGFIGSCDDLLKDQQQQRISDGEQRSSGSDRDVKKAVQKDNKEEETVKEDALKKKVEEETQVPIDIEPKPTLDVIGETEVAPTPVQRPVPSGSPASISRTSLSRKDSFNNWSSDEETNLMMSKMRAFFKTMVAGKMASGLRRSNSGRQGSGGEAHSASSSTNGDVPEPVEKVKPPQLVYFENELTRLMKTVPGIRDEQVKEIVEYLSSEETWSDSYDSSDYTSSDLEGAGMCYHGRGPSGPLRTELQQQISASCQQIIRNFDNCTDDIEDDENFVRPKSNGAPISDAMHKETAFVYQRLVASFGKVAGGVGEPSSSDASSTPHSSPPLIAKVMHHIGGRLVALMHEVSAAGEGPLPSSSSPNGSPFSRNINAAGSPKTGNNQVAATMAARYRRLLRREAAAAAKDDKGSVTSTSVESECPSTDTEERSVDSDADSSSSSPPPMSRLPSLPRSKSHDLGQWQRLLLANEENRKVTAAHSYYYGYSAMGSTAMGGGVVGPGTMMSSSGVHPGGVGGRDNKESLRSSSSGVSDLAEEREEYERLSWRGSFESALAADSRTKLSLEAKRRSAGSGSGSASDLCSSNDQLDHRGRVRSCGSITSAGSRGSLLQQQQLGARARLSASGGDLLAYRSSASRGTVAEEHEGEGDDEGDGDVVGSNGALSRRRRSVPDARGPPGERSTTLPRSNTAVSASTNSLPRLPTGSAPPHGTAAAAIHKSQSLMGHHLQQAHQQQQQQPHHHHHHLFLQNVKSARYRPPGFRPPPVPPVPPKRAVSVPGLNHQSRGRGEKRRQSSGDDAISISETMGKGSSQPIGNITPTAGSAPPTPGGGKKASTSSWTSTPPTSPAVIAGGHNANEDETSNERVPTIHQQSSTLSSLGLRSDSMASVYSGAGEGRYGTVAVRGEVEFALQYNYKQGALEILVKQCRELAPVDTKRNRSDPYVKVYLLPDKSKSGKRKTKVKKHTLNPVFDETLKFHITLNGLETRTLWLTVWHSDMFGRNDFLGEVMMSLENKVFDDPTPKWYPLQERTEPFDDLLCYKGEMIVGLKFVPPDVTNLHKKGRLSRGSLHVLVKDAKNLTAVKTNGTSDPFCKSYLLPDKGRSSKQKTAVCRRTVNPVWNHTFVYEDVSLQELSERSLELTVWDHDRLASNEFLGGLRFNLGTGKHYGKSVDWMDATGREMTLWQSMLERANFWVEGCLTLRPTLDHRSSPSSTLAS